MYVARRGALPPKRGDMSRGALLLRCIEKETELRYLPLLGATVRGAWPAKLVPSQ